MNVNLSNNQNNQINPNIQNNHNNQNKTSESPNPLQNFQMPFNETKSHNSNTNFFDSGFSPFLNTNVHNLSFSCNVKGRNLFNTNK